MTPWALALRAADLLCVARGELGGLWLRARPGPARDALLDRLAPLEPRRCPPGITDAGLFGGIDLAQALASGRLVGRAGLLDTAPALLLPMAERTETGLAGRLAAARDAGGPVLVALDEAAPDEGAPPAPLTERLGAFAVLDGIALADLAETPPPPDLAAARAVHARARVPDALAAALVATAARLGIATLRAPRFAIAAARANAALDGRDEANEDDAALAVRLCLAHRGTSPPETEEEQEAPDEGTEDGADAPPDRTDADRGRDDGDAEGDGDAGADRLVEAARAALPPGLLATLRAARARRDAAASSGAGARTASAGRGRPLPPRPGRAGAGRIDAAATLRAAAPWQTLRRRAAPDDPRRLLLRPGDIRLARSERRTDRLVIFAVDASGSAAMSRMAEAKGAIEGLLSDSYAARDHVALVAFRREGAEVLLPPTRSLTQSRRRLRALPGGGGTPLAAALAEVADLADRARRAGLTPSLVLLTDGRANIALDGTADRARASAEAEELARGLGLPALVVDTGTRTAPALRALAAALGAPLVSLPRAGMEAALTELPR